MQAKEKGGISVNIWDKLCTFDKTVLSPAKFTRTKKADFLKLQDKTVHFSQNCAQPCQAHKNYS